MKRTPEMGRVGGLRMLPEEGTPFSRYLRKDLPEGVARTGGRQVASRKRLLKENEGNV